MMVHDSIKCFYSAKKNVYIYSTVQYGTWNVTKVPYLLVRYDSDEGKATYCTMYIVVHGSVLKLEKKLRLTESTCTVQYSMYTCTIIQYGTVHCTSVIWHSYECD